MSQKPLSPQDWESLIEDFQHGGSRRHKWSSNPSLLDLALSSILKKDFPLKIQLIIFLEEFSDNFPDFDEHFLERLIDTLKIIVQSPNDNLHITLSLKDQMLVSTTSIFISTIHQFNIVIIESLVEFLLILINRPNHGPDRQTRGVACECLRELERSHPCLLSDIAGHLWSLCQNERTHVTQSYMLLFTWVIHNIVVHNVNVSILNTSVPLVPFNVPQSLLSSDGCSSNSNSNGTSNYNYKELRRAMAFLLESPQVLTACGMVEFMAMIIPIAVALELQASMLKVQFFGMVYSYDPMLCHVVLKLYLSFFDAFDGQEGEIARRLVLISKEAQSFLVFRLLALHWLLGLNQLVVSSKGDKKKKPMAFDLMGLSFYPDVFDPLALKALKLDLLALCMESLKSKSDSEMGDSVEKVFEDGIVSVSAYKWLPPRSTETAVAFRAFHKFLIGGSSHFDTDPSTTTTIMESTIFHSLQVFLWISFLFLYSPLVHMLEINLLCLFQGELTKYLFVELIEDMSYITTDRANKDFPPSK